MKKLFFTITVITMLFLCGCSSTPEEVINEYKENMQNFFSNISELNTKINQIDTDSYNFDTELTSLLDSLNKEFASMSQYEVPQEFGGVKELAEDASQNMNEAVRLYHLAFDSEFYDSESEYTASLYYQKANKELKYIIRILHGEKYKDIIGSSSETSDTSDISEESLDDISPDMDYEDYE